MGSSRALASNVQPTHLPRVHLDQLKHPYSGRRMSTACMIWVELFISGVDLEPVSEKNLKFTDLSSIITLVTIAFSTLTLTGELKIF